MLDIGAAISMSKPLMELAQEIGAIIKKAQESPDLVRRVLLYLESAQAAVKALGLERQRILTDVRRCDAGDDGQLNALWERLDRYLHEDNIRPQLDSSIRGLRVCRAAIEKEAETAWWRKRDKEAAVKAFSATLNELESVLDGLTHNFYPGASGGGILTLMPIFDLISRVRDDKRRRDFQQAEIDSANEKLGELAVQALRDSSHEEWFRMAGKVEALVTELQLAFSVKVIEGVAKGS